jgi:hypothetical protein
MIEMLNSTQPHGLPICDILGLYHVLMYVCRLHWFVVPVAYASSLMMDFEDLGNLE